MIDVRPDGSFRLGDEAADANSIAQRIAATMPGQAERLILRGGAAVSDEQFRAAVMALEAAGLKDRKIEINRFQNTVGIIQAAAMNTQQHALHFQTQNACTIN